MVWLRNVLRAVIKVSLNYFLATTRLLRNYTTLFFRLSKLALYEMMIKIRITPKQIQSTTIQSQLILDNNKHLNLTAAFSDIGNGIKFFAMRKKTEWRPTAMELKDLIERRWQVLKLPTEASSPTEIVIDTTLVFHVYYLDIAIEIINLIQSKKLKFQNVIITCTDPKICKVITELIEPICVSHPNLLQTENYLRDVAPFLRALHDFSPTGNILKIHTKKSPHLHEETASNWRRSLLDKLVLSADACLTINQTLLETTKPAVFCPAEWISTKKQTGRNGRYLFQMCNELNIPYLKHAPFPMGTMFWANQAMVAQLEKLAIPKVSPIHIERGLLDGTWPHAFERLPGQIVLAAGIGYIA
jgi:hypothetical protein